MGVHDYICFIQRNGQCLLPLELVDPDQDDFGDPGDVDLSADGCNECIVVLVPDNINIDQLEYHQFADYKTIELQQYSADDWDFNDLPGYRPYLMNGFDDAKGGNPVRYPGIKDTDNHAIWRHKQYPGYNLVNFHPVAYTIFVSQVEEPQELSYSSYRAILGDRDITSYTADKQLLYNLVVGSRVVAPYKTKPLEALPDNGLQYIAERCSNVLSIIAQYAMPEEWLHEPKGVSSEMLVWLRKEGIITKEQRADSKFSNALFQLEPRVVKELFSYWDLDISNIIDNLHQLPLESLVMIRQQRPAECKAAINFFSISLPGNVDCLKELVDNWGLIITDQYMMLPPTNLQPKYIELKDVTIEGLQYIRKRFVIQPPQGTIVFSWLDNAINKLVVTKDRALYQELCHHWGLTLDYIRSKTSLTTAIIAEYFDDVRFLMSLGMTIDDITHNNSYAITNLAQNGRGEAMIRLLAEYGLNRSHVVTARDYAVRYGRDNIVKALDQLPPNELRSCAAGAVILNITLPKQ